MATLPVDAQSTDPKIAGVKATDEPDPDGTVRVRLSIDVDDGTYEFRTTLTRWHEKA